jgi:hypothetical protein
VSRALSKINNALDGKFCFLRNLFTDGSKLSWNHSVNISRYPTTALVFVYDWKTLVFKCSGLCRLIGHKLFKFVVPLAFEQVMNVIRSLDILRPAALSSARWTKDFVGKSLQHRPLSSALYTSALAQDPALQFFFRIFTQKDQQLRLHKIISLPLWLENGLQIAFLSLSSHPSLALK